MLSESYGGGSGGGADDVLSEDDARAGESATPEAGLGNADVLLRFYDEPPQDDNRDFHHAAVFELLSLGLSALFQIVVDRLNHGPVKPADLVAGLKEKQHGEFWDVPLAAAAPHLPSARSLAHRLLAAEEPFERAAAGGALLTRLFRDQPLAAVATDLATNPAFALAHEALRSPPERSLAEAFPELVRAMVERHHAVSANKNRQRWCYYDGGILRKDDLQEMRVGFHSFRFPQLYSLCRDLGLKGEELRHGG